MALRVARGLFRLWLVLSVLWIGAVGILAWWTFPVLDWVLISASQEPGKAIFEMRAPDGKTYKITGPEGATKEDAQGELIRQSPDLGHARGKPISAEAAGEERRLAIWHASLLAFLPPALVLALGSALVWAFRGFG